MKLDDIIALCKAGYTKDDLAKLMTIDSAAPAAPVAQDDASIITQLRKASDGGLIPAARDDNGIIAAINALGAQIKTMNIAATEQPKPQTAEDVLASIILPSKAGE